VQHITAGFLPGLASWLAQTTGIRVQIAAHGLPPHPGHVYLAPDDFHLGLQAGRLQLTREAPESGLRPAVDVLFRSLAEQCGAQAIGVLLTGMGKDGAQGLRLMRERGATTIAQDRDSSVVFGMPGAAVRLDAATHVLPAERIGPALIELCERSGQLKEQR
jgi:two-component system, chemotaxis family, protein-glutamate methylesterase/glutaminase